MPENDSWRYGGNVSFVCSAFAFAVYQAAFTATTLLTDITATEQTPIDNVRMAIFDGAKFNASNCPVGAWAPNGGAGRVCQLLGSTRMPLDGFNTIPLYANANAACGSQWPRYERCVNGAAPGCEC